MIIDDMVDVLIKEEMFELLSFTMILLFSCNRAVKIKKMLQTYTLFGQVVVFGFPFYNKHRAIYKNVKPTDIIKVARKLVIDKEFFSYVG